MCAIQRVWIEKKSLKAEHQCDGQTSYHLQFDSAVARGFSKFIRLYASLCSQPQHNQAYG